MKARGKREAKRSASPLGHNQHYNSPERAGPRPHIAALQALALATSSTRGDALRFCGALALAVIFRAYGAGLGYVVTFEAE